MSFKVSFEIRSPERGSSSEDHILKLSPLMAFQPVLVSIANHQPENNYSIDNGNLIKNIRDKYPASYYFAIALKEQFKIEVVPHLLCNELEFGDIEDILIGFSYVGIKKVMALRGDRLCNEGRYNNKYSHADELVRHIKEFNVQYKSNFEIGIAGYPDVHPAADSEMEDLLYLKRKTALGAGFITTQLFLNNERFFAYLDKCSKMGVTIPIIPGLKLISDKQSLHWSKKRFNINIPVELEQLMMKSIHREDQFWIGIQWLFQQCVHLIDAGKKHLHFYIFSNEDIKGVLEVLTRLKTLYQ